MKSIKNYILEKYLIDQDTKEEIDIPTQNTKWIAIEITTEQNSYRGGTREVTNQRVVTTDTYDYLKTHDYTKMMAKIVSVYALGPVCKTKDAAMGYLDYKPKEVRKSDIKKGNADYIVYCINTGKMNAAGRTNWDWNFWEEWKDAEIYMDEYARSFIIGAPGSFKPGDKLVCVDNDSHKKLPGAPKTIDAVCKCNIDDFRKCVRDNYPTICKPPKRAFGKEIDGIPWQRMGQFYSIKGIE